MNSKCITNLTDTNIGQTVERHTYILVHTILEASISALHLTLLECRIFGQEITGEELTYKT